MRKSGEIAAAFALNVYSQVATYKTQKAAARIK
jgi:hypothetical protein